MTFLVLISKFLSNCYHVGTWNFGWSDSVFLDHESLLFDSKINSLLSPTRWEMCFCVSNIIGWHETPDSEWCEPPEPPWIAPPTEDHVSHIQMPKTIGGYLISITQEVTTKPNSALSLRLQKWLAKEFSRMLSISSLKWSQKSRISEMFP